MTNSVVKQNYSVSYSIQTVMIGLSVTDYRDMHVAGMQPLNCGDEYAVT